MKSRSKISWSVTGAALAFSFFTSGCLPVILWLMSRGILPSLPYEYLVFFLPALIVSLPLFLLNPGIWSSVPVLLVFLMASISLVWLDPSERGRGVLILASLLTAAVTSAGLQDRLVLLRQMRWFVRGSLITTLVGLLLWVGAGMNTFGSFEGPTGSILTNRNAVAAHLVAAAIIALCQAQLWRKPGSVSGMMISYGPFAILAIGVVLTGSRGGFLTLLAGCFVATFGLGGSKRGWPIFWSFYGAACSLALFITVPNPVMTRLQRSNTLSFGDRTPIWSAATSVFGSDSSALIHGKGIGGANKALAEAAPDLRTVKAGIDGVARVNAHNGYIDWIVNFGVVGALIGFIALGYIAWRVLEKDTRIGEHTGQAILIVFMFASMTSVPYGSAYSISTAAILLGYLSSKRSSYVIGQSVQEKRPTFGRRGVHATRPRPILSS